MDYANSPFHKFRGWKIWALLVVTVAYSVWFTTSGPYGQYAQLVTGVPLEERGFYSGAAAIEVLSELKAAGHMRAMITALLFDLPYMILLALLFEALIGFGLRQLPLKGAVWPMLFVLPIAFLLSDFAEDSFLALTLVTESELMGSLAGFMTALKLSTFIAASLAGIVLSVPGLLYWIFKGRKAS